MTRSLPLLLVLLAVLCLIQVFGLSRVTLFGVSPDIVTTFVAVISVFTGQRTGMTYGFASGMLTGLLSGNIGVSLLTRTVEGFISGYCHVPEKSHATMTQKSRMLYLAIVLASFFGNLVFNLFNDPLGESLAYRIFISGTLTCMMNLLLGIALNKLFLRKTLSE